MEARPDDLPELADGQKIDAYIGPQTARIDNGAGQPDSLMVSTTPLRARDESGDPVPLDYDLVEGESSYRYENPAMATRLSKDLRDGLLLEKAGVCVMPVTDTAAAPTATDGRLFWSSVATDLDFFVNPAPSGFEFFLQIRSAEAPEAFSVDLDLPDGAVLMAPSKEGEPITIRRGDDLLASVHPPSAWDAEGETLPVTFEIDGGRLTLRFPHRDRDVAYPALVDPLVSGQVYDDFLYWKGTGIPFGRWRYETQPSSRPMFGGKDAGAAADYRGRGLISAMFDNSYYYAGDYGQWLYDAPSTNSFIYRAEFHQAYHRDNYTDLFEGVYSLTRGAWDTGSYGTGAGQGSPWSYPFYLQNDTKVHCVHQGSEPRCGAHNRGRNTAVFGLRANTTMGRGVGPYTYLTGARIFLADTTFPNIYTISHQQDMNRWYRSGTLQTNVGANDNQGLGMRSINLSNYATESFPNQTGCEGDYDSPCSQDLYGAIRYNVAGLSEGINTLQVRAQDILSKSGTSSFQVKVDKTAPTVTPSGSAWTERARWLTEPDPQLLLDASDGLSGIAAVDMRVDYQSASRAPTRTEGSRRTYSLADLREGRHHIEFFARDNAGNQSGTQAFDVIVDRVAPRIPTSALNGVPSGWTKDAKLTLDLAGDDKPDSEADFGTGILALAAEVDGRTAQRRTFGCAGGPASRCERTQQASLALDTASSTDFPDDGVRKVSPRAEDAVRSTRGPGQDVRIDREGPRLALSGPLWENKQAVPYEDARLRISASEGTRDGQPTERRSGTSQIQVFVDGDLPPGGEPPRECPDSSCALDRDFVLDTDEYHEDETHTITVVTTDQVGNRREESWTVQTLPPAYTTEDGDDGQAPEGGYGDGEDGTFCEPDENGSTAYCDQTPENAAAVEVAQEPPLRSGLPFPLAAGPLLGFSPNRTSPDLQVAGRGYGLADERALLAADGTTNSMFSHPDFRSLGIRRARKIVNWNVVAIGDSPQRYCHRDRGVERCRTQPQDTGTRDILDRWMKAAHDAGVEPFISFGKARDGSFENYLPTLAEYRAGVNAFRDRYNGLYADPTTGQDYVQRYSAWNEPNHARQPTSRRYNKRFGRNGAEMAGRYWRELMGICRNRGCMSAAGEFLDQKYLSSRNGGTGNKAAASREYLDDYKAGAYRRKYLTGVNPNRTRKAPIAWAYHAYAAGRYHREEGAARLRSFFKATRSVGSATQPQIWLTEQGGLVSEERSPRLPEDRPPSSTNQPNLATAERLANEDLQALLRLPDLDPPSGASADERRWNTGDRITRFFYYQYFGEGTYNVREGPPNRETFKFDSGLFAGDGRKRGDATTPGVYETYRQRTCPSGPTSPPGAPPTC